MMSTTSLNAAPTELAGKRSLQVPALRASLLHSVKSLYDARALSGVLQVTRAEPSSFAVVMLVMIGVYSSWRRRPRVVQVTAAGPSHRRSLLASAAVISVTARAGAPSGPEQFPEPVWRRTA